jgi:hypothetical protein
MTIGIFPFAFVVFVLLMAMICGGRACRTRAVPAALVGGGLLLLGIGGALLLLVGGLLMSHRHMAWQPPMPPLIEPVLPIPRVAEPRKTIERASESLLAESTEEKDGKGISSSDSDTASSTEAATATGEAAGPPRPAWMDAPQGRIGDIYRTKATVGPYLTLAECEKDLPAALHEAVKQYADRYLGEGKGQYVNLRVPDIHKLIVRGEWEERRQGTIDTMVYLHALLEFDNEANQVIDASARESMVVGRLGYTAAGGGMLLGLLTIVFGYLKLDTLTRGYYTGRLRLTAGAAILGLAVIAGLLVMP